MTIYKHGVVLSCWDIEVFGASEILSNILKDCLSILPRHLFSVNENYHFYSIDNCPWFIQVVYNIIQFLPNNYQRYWIIPHLVFCFTDNKSSHGCGKSTRHGCSGTTSWYRRFGSTVVRNFRITAPIPEKNIDFESNCRYTIWIIQKQL